MVSDAAPLAAGAKDPKRLLPNVREPLCNRRPSINALTFAERRRTFEPSSPSVERREFAMRYDQLRPTASAAPRPVLPGISRRAFLQRTSVLAALGTVGPALVDGGRANAAGASPGIGLAIPIPYGNDFLGDGRLFHVEAPPFPGFGEDPSTVFNFAGTSAIGFVDGTVKRKNRKTGEEAEFPFLATDMRFMQGRFVGRDGHARSATFGFV